MTLLRGELYGYELWCEEPLGWLDQAGSAGRQLDDAIHVVLGDTSTYKVLAPEFLPPGPREARSEVMHLADGRIVAEISVLGSFLLDPKKLEVVAPSPVAEYRAQWEHTLYSWVIPLLLAAAGQLVLHAAAIETTVGALLVVGPSTRGKTSFAAAAAANGYRVLGEDGIAVRLEPSSGMALAYAGCQGVRLRHDATGAERKKFTEALPDDARCRQPRPIAAVVALAERSTHGTEPKVLGAASAISALRANSFSTPESLLGLYPTIAGLARSSSVALVSLRHGLADLPGEVDRLTGWVERELVRAA